MANFLRTKHHIARSLTSTAAFRDVKVPIGRTDVLPSFEAHGASGSVDGLRRPLEFQENAYRSLVKIEMKIAYTKCGSVFFVGKTRRKPQGPKLPFESAGLVERDLPFHVLLVSGLQSYLRVGFERKFGPSAARPETLNRCRQFDTNPEEPAAEAKARLGRVKNYVPLEDASTTARTKPTKTLQQGSNVSNTNLHLDFSAGSRTRRHRPSIAHQARCPLEQLGAPRPRSAPCSSAISRTPNSG